MRPPDSGDPKLRHCCTTIATAQVLMCNSKSGNAGDFAFSKGKKGGLKLTRSWIARLVARPARSGHCRTGEVAKFVRIWDVGSRGGCLGGLAYTANGKLLLRFSAHTTLHHQALFQRRHQHHQFPRPHTFAMGHAAGLRAGTRYA